MKRIIYGSLSVLTAVCTVFLAAKAEVFDSSPQASEETASEVANSDTEPFILGGNSPESSALKDIDLTGKAPSNKELAGQDLFDSALSVPTRSAGLAKRSPSRSARFYQAQLTEKPSTSESGTFPTVIQQPESLQPTPAKPGPIQLQTIPAAPAAAPLTLPANPVPGSPSQASPLPANPEGSAVESNAVGSPSTPVEADTELSEPNPSPGMESPGAFESEPLPSEPLSPAPAEPPADSPVAPPVNPSVEPLPTEPLPVEPLPAEPLPAEPLPDDGFDPEPGTFPESNAPSGESLVGEGFTPFQLSYLAIAGGLREEGIPGGDRLVNAYKDGDLSATDIVNAGEASNRLGTAADDKDDFTKDVDRFLKMFRRDARTT